MDLYLQAMMTGQLNKKDQFEESIEQEVDQYITSLSIEHEPNLLMTPSMRKAKIKAELKEELKMVELAELNSNAFLLLRTDSLPFLARVLHEEMLKEFDQAEQHMEKLDLSGEVPPILQSLLGFSDETMGAILAVAIGMYQAERYRDCLSLFTLLTTLVQDNFEYWFRLGIAAQKCEDLDLALKAYAIAICLNPDLMEARLFSAECYLAQGNRDDAAEEIQAAKATCENNDIDSVWLDLLASLEKQELKSPT